MSNPLPNALALSTINDGDEAIASVLRNNYAAIQTAVNLLRAALAGGTAGQLLQAVDGTDVQWAIPAGTVLKYGTRTANVSTTSTTYAGGADLLASALTFTADGTSSYLVTVTATRATHSVANATVLLGVNLDGAQSTNASVMTTPASGNSPIPVCVGVVITPAAGSHTLNVRLWTTVAGTVTVNGGAGGAAAEAPILVSITKLG